MSGSVYLCLARIVVAYSEKISLLKPRTYTLIFMTCDFVALLMQAAGGAMASSNNNDDSVSDSTNKPPTDSQMGVNIMVAGVGWQVASLGIFAILCGEYAHRVHKEHEVSMNPKFDNMRNTKKFRLFLYALGLATLTIFVRSIFRCAELSGGFHGKLANQQISFMVLEGCMIILAVTSLTIFHPGFAFQGRWNEATWSLGGAPKNGGEPFAGNDKSKWYKFGLGPSENERNESITLTLNPNPKVLNKFGRGSPANFFMAKTAQESEINSVSSRGVV